ncbi:hypothetical protein HELRODRAFT_161046 [Helobdella robusta]|uniref:Major facilitator superfamily (MFS) profile domain-containing protein n=1 Tax=Helobdella robusta TaxID=6412 RepID=T1ER20_HELRO|nr:hypothetical protein HELRODRAFT_161046 [Helobdella robusta]ESO01868.1 hypothetical protein HELRODRAFT_161046 [Helobdella robusta]
MIDLNTAPRFWLSRRWRLAILSCIGFLIVTSNRLGVEVALLCMFNKTNSDVITGQPITARFPAQIGLKEKHFELIYTASDEQMTKNETHFGDGDEGAGDDDDGDGGGDYSDDYTNGDVYHNSTKSRREVERKAGDLSWTTKEFTAIWEAYYLGDLISKIPSALLVQRFGGKKLFTLSILVESICTALTPLAAKVHYFPILLLRLVSGLSAVFDAHSVKILCCCLVLDDQFHFNDSMNGEAVEDDVICLLELACSLYRQVVLCGHAVWWCVLSQETAHLECNEPNGPKTCNKLITMY